MGAVESAVVVDLRGGIGKVRWGERYGERSSGRTSPDSSWTCGTTYVVIDGVEIQAPKQPHHVNAALLKGPPPPARFALRSGWTLAATGELVRCLALQAASPKKNGPSLGSNDVPPVAFRPHRLRGCWTETKLEAGTGLVRPTTAAQAAGEPGRSPECSSRKCTYIPKCLGAHAT